MKVLIAEDENISRMVLAKALANHGYEVLQAHDGQEAWDVFQKEKEDIHIAILDWQMPRMDGIELCQKIKDASLSHYVYVIFLTGKKDIDSIVEGLERGADDYLPKPFDRRELLSRLKVGLRLIEFEKALREANVKLHALAITDGLTGISNRRAIFERLRSEISRAVRENSPFCLIMLDIDHFKKVNDIYGHSAGDKVLVEIVNRIKSELRPHDDIGRYGGEEFMVGISKTDSKISRVIAERLRTCICETPFQIEGGKIDVSISLGVVDFMPSRDHDINDLLEAMIKAVDIALYKAKEAGRNRVVYDSVV
ncbi:MAG: diguanylate cyclase response regulator [Deltaproteobacteria bacterium]|nr:MAG: diguanylate cyclase response regulator [Deltaproteobacteria bacterium]